MSLLTILFFFILTISLGYTATYFVKRPEGSLERFFLYIGIGLGVIPILGVFLNLVKVKLHIFVFVGIGMLIPLYALYRSVSKGGFDDAKKRFMKLKLKKSTVYLLVAIFFALVLFVIYLKGSFVYPYLEDDDPWLHASAAKYLKATNTFSQYDDADVSHYLEPYPPGYVILMGILHQTNQEVMWTLKFFNTLIIALGVVFFYLFAKEFIGDRKKALFATFIITVIPCFLSHFIWAASLAIVLFFVTFYCLEKIRDDKRWVIPSAVVVSSIIVTQVSNAFIFGLLFFVYFLIKSISLKKFLKLVFIAGVIGALMGFALYWTPTVVKYGLEETARENAINLHDLESISTKTAGGGLLYAWNDFIYAKKVSKMDNPIGIGFFLFWLVVISLLFIVYKWIRKPKIIFSKDDSRIVTCIIWLLIAFAGIHGNRLPFPMLMPHRWWAILAIPVALLCVEGFFTIGKIFEKFKIHRFIVYAVIVIGILITSGYPKYVVETSYWPPGVMWGSMEELQGYMSYVEPLPIDTKVFPICSPEFKVLAFDKLAEPWDPDYIDFKETAFNKSASQVSSWMRSRGYDFVTLDAYCVKEFGLNSTNEKLKEFGEDPAFQVVAQTNGFFMFRIV